MFVIYIATGMESSHDLSSDDGSNTVAAEKDDEWVQASANLEDYDEDQETQQGETQQQAPLPSSPALLDKNQPKNGVRHPLHHNMICRVRMGNSTRNWKQSKHSKEHLISKMVN